MREFPDMDLRPGRLNYVSDESEIGARAAYANAAIAAAARLGATQSDIPGLWNAPDYPELTTGQLIDVASRL